MIQLKKSQKSAYEYIDIVEVNRIYILCSLQLLSHTTVNKLM